MKRNIFYSLSALLVLIFSSGMFGQDSDVFTKVNRDLAQNISTQDDTTGMNEFIEVEVMPEIITQTKPEYPTEASKNKIEGRVWIKLKVGTNGIPSSVVVVKSSNPIFDEAAVTAAKQYKFSPAKQDGKPVAVWVVIPFKFELAQEKKQQKVEQKCYSINPEKMPSIIGGMKSVYKKLIYPELAKTEKIEGKVTVKVYVDENGNIDATKILKGLGYGCDETAEKAIRTSKFSPAKQDGKNVKAQVNIFVQFKLE
jgi:TonB family protein